MDNLIYVGKEMTVCGKHGIVESVDAKKDIVLIKTERGYLATQLSKLKKEQA